VERAGSLAAFSREWARLDRPKPRALFAMTIFRLPNGSDAKLRGQGPCAEADAALGVHAFESRDAGRAPQCSF